MIAEGCIDVSKLAIGTKVFVESSVGTTMSVEMLDPVTNFVLFYSTDPRFREGPPRRTYFRESWSAMQPPLVIPGCIIKHMRMVIEFADAKLITEPIVSAMVEGNGWHYEVFK